MPSKRDVLQPSSPATSCSPSSIGSSWPRRIVGRRTGSSRRSPARRRPPSPRSCPSCPRDRLKEICRALGPRRRRPGEERARGPAHRRQGSDAVSPPAMNGAGRSRTARPAPATAERSRSRPARSSRSRSSKGTSGPPPTSCAGRSTRRDYKGFIFGMLFLKRLSDRFDEECDALRSQPNADPDDPDEHDFFVPKRARWSEIQRVATGVGETLNKACAELEQKNDKLEGVLAGIDFNDERKLGDAQQPRQRALPARAALLAARPAEREPLGARHARARVRVPDREVRRRRRQEGRRVLHARAWSCGSSSRSSQPAPGMRICDPTCGSGGMLIECAHYLERHGQNPRNLSLYGQEKNLGTWAICADEHAAAWPA